MFSSSQCKSRFSLEISSESYKLKNKRFQEVDVSHFLKEHIPYFDLVRMGQIVTSYSYLQRTPFGLQ